MEGDLRKIKHKRSLLVPLAYEFFGTALLTYSFNLSADKSNNPEHLVRAAAYFIGWLIAASVSGAHFNPAVSLAVFIFEAKKSLAPIFFLFVLA